ncbi:hypothetical protein [Streptomyces sp. NPDC046887]|uniref:hypothetical protein n=1 Tax=Streptomyces sp. NPDC046887 TaxID=3155472 RepID=UPI00340D5099
MLRVGRGAPLLRTHRRDGTDDRLPWGADHGSDTSRGVVEMRNLAAAITDNPPITIGMIVVGLLILVLVTVRESRKKRK